MEFSLCNLLSTVAGEAGACDVGSWQAVACSIMNRVGHKEWKKYTTPMDIIAFTGYDAFTHKNHAYRTAFEYFQDRVEKTMPVNNRLDNLRAVVQPIFRGEVRPYPTIVLYFSPMAQIAFHQANPEKYKRARPNWNFDILKRVSVPGDVQDDMAFYAYK